MHKFILSKSMYLGYRKMNKRAMIDSNGCNLRVFKTVLKQVCSCDTCTRYSFL